MKTSNFHLFWIVHFHHRCYSTISCKAAWSAKAKFGSYWVIIDIIDVAQTYRIPSDSLFTGDPLHSRAACTQPCNVNTHSRAHCSPGARLCEQWEHGCVNNGARLCASARLCRGSPVLFITTLSIIETHPHDPRAWECACIAHLYWNWYDAVSFVTLPLIQCMYVLHCRVIICLYNRFMNVRPQVPPTFSRTNAVFFIIPFKFQ